MDRPEVGARHYAQDALDGSVVVQEESTVDGNAGR